MQHLNRTRPLNNVHESIRFSDPWKILGCLKLTQNVRWLISYKALNILVFQLNLCASNYAVFIGNSRCFVCSSDCESFSVGFESRGFKWPKSLMSWWHKNISHLAAQILHLLPCGMLLRMTSETPASIAFTKSVKQSIKLKSW